MTCIILALPTTAPVSASRRLGGLEVARVPTSARDTVAIAGFRLSRPSALCVHAQKAHQGIGPAPSEHAVQRRRYPLRCAQVRPGEGNPGGRGDSAGPYYALGPGKRTAPSGPHAGDAGAAALRPDARAGRLPRTKSASGVRMKPMTRGHVTSDPPTFAQPQSRGPPYACPRFLCRSGRLPRPSPPRSLQTASNSSSQNRSEPRTTRDPCLGNYSTKLQCGAPPRLRVT